ncbi:MAG: NAD(P)/FAD-dependent oxidoreductase [Chthoniobacterales bacterium]
MYDVAIIGAGPAGLSAALILGRCRRNVIVIDAGHPRNAASGHMHGFLSRDGVSPKEFLKICRDQLSIYPGVELQHGTVTECQRLENSFDLRAENGATFSSKLLLLATGLIDPLPPLRGIEKFYGSTVHHCPYCDGWEHRDQAIAVYATGAGAIEFALELTCWSRDVVLCTNGGKVSREDRERLRTNGVECLTESIVCLEGDGDQLTAIRFGNGKVLPRQALFFETRPKTAARFARDMKCDFTDDISIRTGDSEETNIPGVFVVGNASDGLQMVVMAAAEGASAAYAINELLLNQSLVNQGAKNRIG